RRLYFDGGDFGGLYGRDARTGAPLFFGGGLEQYDEWSPVFFGGAVYTFVEGHLRRHDPLPGAVSWAGPGAWDWNGWSMRTSPVSDGRRIYVIAPPTLYAFEPPDATPRWSAQAAFTGMPAVVNNVVYALSAGQLQALDADTGAHLWSFAGDSALEY